uniref:DNA mismatch repair protein Mlh1 n=1 Tax=Schistosoma haematobium TaxID=6185 RepID=A0A095A0P6_SCHHA
MNDFLQEHIKSVSGTVLELIQEGLFSNVTVVMNDHEFKSNSLLLASSSDYFRALFSFQQNSVEEPRLEIKCDYVSHVGLSHVMLFINSIGQVHDSIPTEDYQDVYIASSFLQVHCLRKMMSLRLEGTLCTDNVLKIMNLAHWFDDDALFKKAILFLWHEFQLIDYFSSDFVNLTTKQITKIFQSDQINISQERVVLEAILVWLCHDVKRRMEFFKNNFLHLVRLPLITRNELMEIISNPKYSAANDALQFLFLAHNSLNQPSFLNELEKFSISDIWSYQFLPNSLIDPKQYRPRNTSASYELQSNEFMVYNEDLSVATTYTPPYAASRVHHGVAASLNWIYVVGGESEEGELLNHCSRFSLTDLVWHTMSELDSPRSHHTLICIENYLYVFGGYCLNWATNYSPASDSILTYDICTNKWNNSNHKLPFGLVDTCALLLTHKGLIMFAGGLEEYGDEMRPSDCALLYDPTEEDGENFKFLPKLPMPLISVALACDTVENQVFLCGGRMSVYGSELDDISNKVFCFNFSTITVKDGGLKLIQVQDNGCGIHQSDLPILCERFTTSKLKEFSDLSKISTFGFRGEALSSLSHVALVTVTTRTANQNCAFKVRYRAGVAESKPVPCAGNPGTTIVAENLFYNAPIRKSALKNGREELSKVTDVVAQYAIHYAQQCGFHLHSESATGKSSIEQDLRTSAGWSRTDAIRAVIGSSIEQNLISFTSSQCSSSESTRLAIERYGLRYEGLLTAPNQVSSGKLLFLYGVMLILIVSNKVKKSSPSLKLNLFINNRLVSCTPIKRIVECAYSSVISRGLSSNPIDQHQAILTTKKSFKISTNSNIMYKSSTSNSLYVYLNIQLPAHTLDVNVHPTKAEVNFLHEVSYHILLPNEKVRIDLREQQLERFLSPQSNYMNNNDNNMACSKLKRLHNNSLKKSIGEMSPDIEVDSDEADEILKSNLLQENGSLNYDEFDWNKATTEQSHLFHDQKEKDSDENEVTTTAQNHLKSYTNNNATIDNTDTTVSLTSRPIIKTDASLSSQNTTTNSLLSKSNTLLTYSNNDMIESVSSKHRHRTIILREPAPLADLLSIGHEYLRKSSRYLSNISSAEFVKKATATLVQHASMLWDYFSIKITTDSNGNQVLTGIPLIIADYIPELNQLPIYVTKLATQVSWSVESVCFENICCITANFYAVSSSSLFDDCSSLPISSSESIIDDKSDKENTVSSSSLSPREWMIQHILWPILCSSLLPSRRYPNFDLDHNENDIKSFSLQSCFIRLTSLTELYKVFERC